MTTTSLELHQQQLAVVHELIWVHEAITARRGELASDSRAAVRTYRRERRRLRTQLRTHDAEPNAPLASYDTAFLDSAAATRKRIVTLVNEMIRIQVALVSATTDQDRADVIAGLLAASRDAVAWGAPAEAWPGLTPVS